MTTLLIFLSYYIMNPAFGWGLKGHETINGAAVHFMTEQSHPFGSFLSANEQVLKHLGQTPDREWHRADKRETMLHFFEVDAFIRPESESGSADVAIVSLPTGDYRAVQGQYGALLLSSSETLAGFNRTSNAPESYGTAPWRVLQLYDEGVAALRARDLPKALLCLGTLGHYLADLAQPLHTTLHYDGEYHPLAARGVHDAIESEAFESKISAADVLQLAAHRLGTRGIDGLTRTRVAPELLKLVSSGWSGIAPLIQTYAAAKNRDAGRVLASDALGNAGLLGFTQERMAEATLLLARVWAAAYFEAGAPRLEPIAIPLKTINPAGNYLPPTYLPSP